MNIYINNQQHLKLKGILSGFFAIMLWALLPLLRQASAVIPPMQLVTIALAVAAIVSTSCWSSAKVQPIRHIRHPIPVWTGSVGGLIGALYLYFMALVRAPAAEVTLITYIWPLIFALAAELQQLKHPSPETLLGACVAFIGAGILITQGSGLQLGTEYLPGYLAGIGSGICWVIYSLVMRNYGGVTAPSFPWIFGFASLLSLLLHLSTETTWLGTDSVVWFAAIIIGCGPYGLAFVAWSFGVRMGPPGVISSLAYATPVLSTIFLIIFGKTQANWQLAVAIVCILLGAVIAGAKHNLALRKNFLRAWIQLSHNKSKQNGV